jgi:hypothetical protein
MFLVSLKILSFADAVFLNSFHTIREISRLSAMMLVLLIYFAIEKIGERNVVGHFLTHKADKFLKQI